MIELIVGFVCWIPALIAAVFLGWHLRDNQLNDDEPKEDRTANCTNTDCEFYDEEFGWNCNGGAYRKPPLNTCTKYKPEGKGGVQ